MWYRSGSATAIDVFVHLYEVHHGAARERLQALPARMVDTGDESDLAFVLIWSSWLETRCGSLDDAARLAEEPADLARLTGSTSMETWAHMQRAYVAAHTGDEDEARRACAEHRHLEEEIGHGLLGLWVAATAALAEISVGDEPAAWEACAPLVELHEQHGIGEPVVAFYLPDALDALPTLGHLDHAEAQFDVLAERGRDLGRAWAPVVAARCRGHLRAALIRAADEEFTRIGMTGWHRRAGDLITKITS